MNLIFRCTECNWIGLETDIIRFNDPELSGNIWSICPNCRSAEQFENICDEPNCTSIASCGWPSTTGYRRTCHIHWNRI